MPLDVLFFYRHIILYQKKCRSLALFIKYFFNFMDYFITLLHLSFFGIANLCFVYAVYQRLRIVFKGQAVGRLAPIEERIRSVLFNVIFQFKLFKRPIRGLMHAFIFYGFLSYLIHTTSQMIAGNTWTKEIINNN